MYPSIQNETLLLRRRLTFHLISEVRNESFEILLECAIHRRKVVLLNVTDPLNGSTVSFWSSEHLRLILSLLSLRHRSR